MPIKQIKTRRVDEQLPLPVAEPNAAAFDLPCRQDVTVEPGKIAVVPVNSIVRVPDGYFLLIALRSSTPLKKGLMLANGVGIVDPFYCGDQDEIVVQLLNITAEPVRIARGECLAQGMFVKVEQFMWHEVNSMNRQRADGIGYDLRNVNRDIISA